MKYVCLSILLLMVGSWWACSDDDMAFDVMASNESIRFRAVPGGAMMYYDLPDDRDVFAVLCRYKDCRGQDVLKRAGYGGDSLVLDGFNEAMRGVPVAISLVNRRNEESEAIEMTFDTEASAPYAFFDSAQVVSSWDGFQLMYTAPETVSGMYHVFYIGTNPLTQELDTILVQSMPIQKGGDTVLFAPKQENPVNTVVVRTEDHRGFRVKQGVWPDIEVYHPKKLTADELEFMDVRNLNVRSEQDKLDIPYLFDGDVKGSQRLKGGNGLELYAFLAGPWAVNAPFIIDLKGDEIPAKVRIYAQLGNQLSYPTYNIYAGLRGETGEIWLGRYNTKIPCDVSIYGGNSADPDAGDWVELGHFEQEPDVVNSYMTTNQPALEEDCWATRCIYNTFYNYEIATIDDAEPAYLEIIFPAQPVTYKYLKLVVNDLFDNYTGMGDMNYSQYFTMQELEVYVKED